jgi:Flp pilus assembly pilin Flp
MLRNVMEGRRAWLQSGQGMVEYAFILVLISLVVLVMLITTGGQIRNLFSDITYTLNNQAGL